jgi:hypothetical protein
MKLLLLLAALSAIALPGAAYAQLAGENLLVNMPDGFAAAAQTASKDGGLSAAEFIPTGETLETWSSMVTVQVFRKAKVGPKKFLAQLKTGWEGACPNSKVEHHLEGGINGYRYVEWYFGCPLNPKTNKPESMWLKVMRGEDALYVVQYSFRALPDDKLEATALAYLAKVGVCDTRKPEHPCPATK